MRFTTVSSSIASVVSRVIGFVAGIAVRTFLHLTQMREHLLSDLGYWLEPCQPGFASDKDIRCLSRLGNPQPGKQPGLLRLLGISVPVVCLAPSAAASAVRLDSVRTKRLG